MKNIFINNNKFEADDSESILQVAKRNGIDIQTLCYLEECQNKFHCGVCLVEVDKTGELIRACSTLVEDGMRISTNTNKVQNTVRNNISELLNRHNFNCGTCVRKGSCEFFDIIIKNKAKKTKYIEYVDTDIDTRSSSIIYDRTKCIKCGRCVSTCRQKSGTEAIRFQNLDYSFDDTKCILCGQCVANCPVGALYEKSHLDIVKKALMDKSKHVVVAIAPSVRTALGEEFKMGYGIDVTKKVYTALRKLGFNKIFDVNFGADITVVEEVNEFIERIKNNGPFPMYTSCCPGWVRLVENYYPELINSISTTKPPQQILGVATKTYYPSIEGLNPSDIFTVTVMPCTAKKFEINRDEMINRGLKNIDATLTTRELAKLIKESGIDISKIEDGEVDKAMGKYTGAGILFGVTSGVMEAALRSIKDLVEGKSFEEVDYEVVRGFENIKEATVSISGQDYNIAIINGTKNFVKFYNSDLLNKKKYHFIEVMACPGGCINGGGQPIIPAEKRERIDYKKERASVLYNQDKKLVYRKSHKNEAVLKMYEVYIGKPGNDIAEELFHAKYNKKTY